MYELLTCTQQEVARLAQNSKAMFDYLPDMLFIIKRDYTIECMNEKALSRLGNQNGRKCHEVIAGRKIPCNSGTCPFSLEQPECRVIERKIGDNLYVEYSHIPFKGYRQDELSLAVIRDFTRENTGRYGLNFQPTAEAEDDTSQQETGRLAGCGMMIGKSRSVRDLKGIIGQVAASDATILITGESGTGKELVADLLHRNSSRSDKRYLKINCAAVSESLLESELFGHERGAFTGANTGRKGKFEEADKGTIFLDEIGEISPRMQTVLLRVLQKGEILRVGSNRTVSVDVRVIAATNADLAAMVEAGKFRMDLYYRLNVVNLHQVPLRERKEDIIPLAENFLLKYGHRFRKEVSGLPAKVVEKLISHNWPGNVRELENAIQRAVLLSGNGVISPDSLGISRSDALNKTNGIGGFAMNQRLNRTLRESVSFFEAEVISQALMESGGNIDMVSRQLGLGKTTLYEKMKRYGIVPRNSRKSDFNRQAF